MPLQYEGSVVVRIEQLKDKAGIEAFLRTNAELHIYSLGDLDDFFWPQTTWYGWHKNGQLQDIVLIYAGTRLPTVVAISGQPGALSERIHEIIPLLPQRFYAHLSPGAEDVFEGTHQLDFHGPHYKMALRDTSRLAGCLKSSTGILPVSPTRVSPVETNDGQGQDGPATHGQDAHATRSGLLKRPLSGVDCSAAVRLGRDDLDELVRLYDESYPGNWFDPRMLQTGQYFGLRVSGQLVSAAGVHVYSEQYRVAAVGNVVTHPAHRNKGYGRTVTAQLCQSLMEKVKHIGLNVKADNDVAIACYRRLGFEIVAPYGEFTVEQKSGS